MRGFGWVKRAPGAAFNYNPAVMAAKYFLPSKGKAGEYGKKAYGELGEDIDAQGAATQGLYDPVEQAIGGYDSLKRPVQGLNAQRQQDKRPTASWNYYAGEQYAGGPKQVNSYVNSQSFRPQQQVSDRYNTVNGAKRPTTIKDRIVQRSSQAPSGQEQETGAARGYAYGPGRLDDRISQLELSPHDTGLATLAGIRHNQAETRGNVGNYLDDSKGMTFDANTTDLMSQIRNAGSGDRYGGEVYDTLKDGGGYTGQFMRDFDPRQSEGLRDEYQMLSSQGPGMQEQFAGQLMNGENPFWERLVGRSRQNAQRGAAARGNFMSGMSAQQENEAENDLRAKQLQEMGAITGQAQAAQNARFNTRLDAAGKLDSHLQGNNKLQAETGAGADSLMARLGLGRDDAARMQNDQLGLLARFGDEQSLGAFKERGSLANMEDTNQIARRAGADKVQFESSQNSLFKEKNLTDARKDADAAELARRQYLQTILAGGDHEKSTRERAADDLTLADDKSAADFEKELNALAKGSSDEGYRSSELGLRGAEGASREDQDYKKYLLGAAGQADTTKNNQDLTDLQFGKGAGDEELNYLKSLIGDKAGLARDRAGSKEGYDSGKTAAQAAAIDAMLQQMGIDQKTSDEFKKAFFKAGATATGYALGGPAGGAAGSKAAS